MQKPRRFNHSPIYMDSQRERLAEIEQKARMELLGIDASEETSRTSLKGCFTKNRREHQSFIHNRQTFVLMFILILLTFFIWKLLL